MANQSKLPYLLAAFTALAASGLTSACQQPVVPSDADLTKTYMDNRAEYGRVAEQLMAEGNQKFSVARRRAVSYQGDAKPPVKDATIVACQQMMGRTFCLEMRRVGGTAYFIYYENQGPDFFRRKSVVYDKDNFQDPVWTPKTSDTSNLRYVPIDPNWRIEYKYDKRSP